MTDRRRGARVRRLAAMLVAGVAAVSCAVPDPVDEVRELGRQGRHVEAAERAANAARTGGARPAPLRAEALRQQELRATQLAETFASALRESRLADAQEVLLRLQAEQPGNPRAASMREQLVIAQRHRDSVARAAEALAAGREAEARRAVLAVLAEDPSHPGARRLSATMPPVNPAPPARAEAAESLPEALRRPVTLEFRDATLRNVFETLARTSNVNFVFDRDVRSDTRVTVFLRGVSLDEAVRTILQTQGLDMRRLNEATYLVYPNTAAKGREYVPLEARAFWLSNADAKQAAAMLRSVVKSRDVYVDDKLNMIVVKDTPDAVRLAAQLLQSIDVAEPEVVLEVEVLEIGASRLQELGIRYPTQISYGLPPPVTTVGGAVSTASTITRQNWGEQVAQIASPSLVANLRATDGAVNLLSNPRIRVRNREKARIQVGEKVPVFTTQFAATGIGVSNAIGASTTYIDVGLKVELEPQVHLENEVAMKVQLEVSNILEQISGPAQTTAFRIGTRQAQTVLRLADGETQVLAGLISDADRVTAQRVPGLGRLPLLGRMFSNELTQVEKSEIVLMITPRIVREIPRGLESARGMSAGTDAAAGVPPLTLAAGARTGVATTGGGGRPAAASREAAEPPPAASAAPAAGAVPRGDARLSLVAPPSARPGQDVALGLTIEGASLRSAEIDVAYDSPAFGIPGPVVTGTGRITVTLSGAPGAALSGRLVLRANPAGIESGTVSVLSVRAVAQDGSPVTGIDLPAPVTLRIAQ
jgi:general secretion pathway protein D